MAPVAAYLEKKLGKPVIFFFLYGCYGKKAFI
jgi:ABC-type phosphate/phosphonate transport system substrate-binding protein